VYHKTCRLVVLEGDVEDRDLLAGVDDIRARAAQLNPVAGITDFPAITAFTASGQNVGATRSAAGPVSAGNFPLRGRAG
jgi:hypothetical protein